MIVEQTDNQPVIKLLVFSVGPKSNVAPSEEPAVKPVSQSEEGSGSHNQHPSTGDRPNSDSNNAIDLTA